MQIRKAISISLNPWTLEEIDEARGAVSRSRFIEDLVKSGLRSDAEFVKTEDVVSGYV